MHLQYAVVLAAVLAGLGIYGMLARRNAVLVLIGLELVLAAGTLLLITAGARPLGLPGASPATADAAVSAAGAVPAAVLTLFVITIAAAEVVVALAVVLLLFRRRGDIDLERGGDR